MAQSIYILTAEMDGDNFAWLDGLRRHHFPADRNVLSAHLTMFHRLTPLQARSLRRVPLPQAPIALVFDRPLLLGSGVAIIVKSTKLEMLRDQLKRAIKGDLSAQDAQNWKPHVTIQNKVPADIAKTLFNNLANEFVERTGHMTGLLLWEYLGGPWKLAQQMTFGAN